MVSDSEVTSSACALCSYNGSLSAMLEVISQKPERCRIIVASHNEESVRRAAKWSVVNITSTSNKDSKQNISTSVCRKLKFQSFSTVTYIFLASSRHVEPAQRCTQK